MPKDPYAVLGIDPTSDTTEVKRAFRALAMQFHPDVSTAPDAATRFEEVRKAADAILNRGRVPVHAAAAAGYAADAAARSYRTERMIRHPQFPLWFSVACLLGGCVIFAGALHAHQDLYTYNVAKEAEERRKNPSEAQRRIAAMLMERRAQTLGGGGGSSGGLVGAAAGGEQAYSDRPR